MIRNRIGLRIVILALVLTSALIAGACGSDAAEEAAPAAAAAPARVSDDGTVVIAWTGYYNSLDPPDSLVTFNREASVGLYDRLLTYDLTARADGSLVWNGLEQAPGLAESWEIDGGSVTFKIRKGVTFNKTGNPLTAEDIKYSFVRAIEVPGYGSFNSGLAGLFEPARQITVHDDYTIQFDYELRDGTPFLLTASLPSMRFPIFGIVDSVEVAARATDEDPWGHEWLKENPEGSGPYTIESATPDVELILKRVPGHWTEQGYDGFDRVIYRKFNSAADITALMLGGEVDVTFALGTRELNSLAEAGFKVVNADIPDIWRLDFPTNNPPYDNVLVRQAVAYATPYKTIVDNAFSEANRAYSLVNPASPSFIPAWNIYDTNLDRARELLEEAGLADGFATDLYYDSSKEGWEDIGLFLKASLSEVGIDVILKPLPATEYGEQRAARIAGEEGVMDGLLFLSGTIWLDDADPNVGLWLVGGGFANNSHYANERVDALHFDNRFNPDLAARAAAYREIQTIAANDVPLLPLAVRGWPGAVHPDVTGVAFTADPHLRAYLLRPAN